MHSTIATAYNPNATCSMAANRRVSAASYAASKTGRSAHAMEDVEGACGDTMRLGSHAPVAKYLRWCVCHGATLVRLDGREGAIRYRHARPSEQRARHALLWRALACWLCAALGRRAVRLSSFRFMATAQPKKARPARKTRRTGQSRRSIGRFVRMKSLVVFTQTDGVFSAGTQECGTKNVCVTMTRHRPPGAVGKAKSWSACSMSECAGLTRSKTDSSPLKNKFKMYMSRLEVDARYLPPMRAKRHGHSASDHDGTTCPRPRAGDAVDADCKAK